jgi:hypothetical protein
MLLKLPKVRSWALPCLLAHNAEVSSASMRRKWSTFSRQISVNMSLVAHIHQNGRMTMMFCSFSSEPLILRLYGTGEVVRPDTARWQEVWNSSKNSAVGEFPDLPGKRQLIVVHIESVQTSCGFGVPIFKLQQERSTLLEWAQKKGVDGVKAYQTQKNHTSIDGLATYLLT